MSIAPQLHLTALPSHQYSQSLIRIAEMLIEEAYKDVSTKADGNGSMRRTQPSLHTKEPQTLNILAGIYIFHPKIPNYPQACFPGVVVFSEIYQGNIIPVFPFIYIDSSTEIFVGVDVSVQ